MLEKNEKYCTVFMDIEDVIDISRELCIPQYLTLIEIEVKYKEYIDEADWPGQKQIEREIEIQNYTLLKLEGFNITDRQSEITEQLIANHFEEQLEEIVKDHIEQGDFIE